MAAMSSSQLSAVEDNLEMSLQKKTNGMVKSSVMQVNPMVESDMFIGVSGVVIMFLLM